MKKTSAYLLGALIGVLIVASAIIVASVPRLDQGFERHKRLIQAVWFTVALFIVCVYRLWRQRHRNAPVYWAAMGIFFLLHIVVVLFFSLYVHPILVYQWIIVLTVESYIVVFFIDWATSRPLMERIKRRAWLRGAPRD